MVSARETGQGVADLPKAVDEVIRMQRWKQHRPGVADVSRKVGIRARCRKANSGDTGLAGIKRPKIAGM